MDVMSLRLRLASVLTATVACTACAPSDPVPEPVGLQLRGQELVLVVPLCPGEAVERVIVETAPGEGDGEQLLSRAAESGPGGDIRLPLSFLPQPLPTDAVVSVRTNKVLRASSLDLDVLPASGPFISVDGETTARSAFESDLECPQ